jgi:glucuronosyltransferase
MMVFIKQDLQTFMDGSPDGVIYVSLGSNLNGTAFFLSEGRLEAFQKAFGRLKQRVLWKWELPQMPNQPKNVFISKWFPQQDILGKIIISI